MRTLVICFIAFCSPWQFSSESSRSPTMYFASVSMPDRRRENHVRDEPPLCSGKPGFFQIPGPGDYDLPRTSGVVVSSCFKSRTPRFPSSHTVRRSVGFSFSTYMHVLFRFHLFMNLWACFLLRNLELAYSAEITRTRCLRQNVSVANAEVNQGHG